MTAKKFLEELTSLQSKKELEKNQRFFRDEGKESKFIGVRMAEIFSLAKKYMLLPVTDIDKLLQSKYYEARIGAVSIMDFQARDKKTTSERKKELYELYLSRHDCIDNWDMVDRSAPYVVGGYLFDKPRKVLYKLAKSKNVNERRTAIVATYYFIRQDDVDDTFKIAELLVHDEHDLIQKAVGSWIREAGKRDQKKLLQFLDSYAGTMPRTMLRYAIEKLDATKKKYYLKLYQDTND